MRSVKNVYIHEAAARENKLGLKLNAHPQKREGGKHGWHETLIFNTITQCWRPETAFTQNAQGISQTATFDAYDSGTTVAPRPPRAVIRLQSILHLVDSVSFVQMAVVTDASLRTNHCFGINVAWFWLSVDMLSFILHSS